MDLMQNQMDMSDRMGKLRRPSRACFDAGYHILVHRLQG